jgi:hypothetical protein
MFSFLDHVVKCVDVDVPTESGTQLVKQFLLHNRGSKRALEFFDFAVIICRRVKNQKPVIRQIELVPRWMIASCAKTQFRQGCSKYKTYDQFVAFNLRTAE